MHSFYFKDTLTVHTFQFLSDGLNKSHIYMCLAISCVQRRVLLNFPWNDLMKDNTPTTHTRVSVCYVSCTYYIIFNYMIIIQFFMSPSSLTEFRSLSITFSHKLYCWHTFFRSICKLLLVIFRQLILYEQKSYFVDRSR